MAFRTTDFHDLISLLEQHPEWRAELRRLLLSDEILTLPELVRELVESQKHTDETVRQLIESQKRTDEQIQQLTARVDDLTVRMEQLTARVDDLTVRMEQLTQEVREIAIRVEQLTASVESLVQSVQRIGDDVGRMKEFYLEQRYYSRAAMYFGRLVRRTRTVAYDDLCHILDEALEQGILTEEERDDLIQTDVVVRGRRRTDGEDVYLIVEVSWGIGPHDVERAARRARTFTKLGWQTMPVVAGGWANTDARAAAQQDGVVVLLDGGQITSLS
ncbi:MAG: coiled-coil domain-containing protein [Armatimonadota bacterium]